MDEITRKLSKHTKKAVRALDDLNDAAVELSKYGTAIDDCLRDRSLSVDYEIEEFYTDLFDTLNLGYVLILHISLILEQGSVSREPGMFQRLKKKMIDDVKRA